MMNQLQYIYNMHLYNMDFNTAVSKNKEDSSNFKNEIKFKNIAFKLIPSTYSSLTP